MNSTPVDHSLHPDVVIIGGGAAGIAAAVGASSQGSSVVLIEKTSFPGGRATASLVGTICGLYLTGDFNNPKYVCIGFPREFAEKIINKNNTDPVKKKGGVFFLPYNADEFDAVCNEFLDNPLIKVHYNGEVIDATVKENNIQSIQVKTETKQVTYQPKCVIDSSGAVLPFINKNNSFITEDSYQAAARTFTVSGINIENENTLDLAIIRCLKRGLDEKVITNNHFGLSVVPGSLKEGMAMLKYSLPDEITTANSSHSELDASSERSINFIFDFLSNNSAVFSNAKITSYAKETGIRTGPRNKGMYILNESDVLTCKKFNNGIARGSWPVEIWKPGKQVELKFFTAGDFYEIPASCLISNETNNLFFAGKNISADATAIASARVIGTCLQTGFAAGILASGYSKNVLLESSIKCIRNSLFPD